MLASQWTFVSLCVALVISAQCASTSDTSSSASNTPLSTSNSSCASRLNADCAPWTKASQCAACARAHEMDLVLHGCTVKLVTELCEASGDKCQAQLLSDCGPLVSVSECETCASKHTTDLREAGCTPNAIDTLCHTMPPGPPPSPDRPITKVLLNGSALNEGGRCLDGSPAGFYYQPANPHGKQQDTWVIYLQGGGACYTEEGCTSRSHTRLGSSNYWPETESCDFCSSDNVSNPDFADAHSVFIPYCSGDTHTGQRTNTSAETWGLYFSGHLNVVQIIKVLQDRYNISSANKVLVSGGSAGGIGTFINADYIQSVLQGAQIKAAPNAGYFFPGDPMTRPLGCGYPAFYDNFTAGVPALWTNLTSALWQSYWLPECVANKTAAGLPGWFCQSVSNMVTFMKVPVMIVENMYDTNQIFTQMQAPSLNKASPAQKPEIEAYINYYGNLMRNSLAKFNHTGTNNGLFLSSCLSHGVSASTKINGVTYIAAVGDWFFERNTMSPIHVDTCQGFHGMPCNPTCTTNSSRMLTI